MPPSPVATHLVVWCAGGGGTIPKNVLAMTAPVLLVSGELTEMLAGFLALIGVPATRLNGGCY